VFAFSSLWFAHYLLAALERLRRGESGAPAHGAAPGGDIAALPPLEPPGGFAA
jgi:hypothetical protein